MKKRTTNPKVLICTAYRRFRDDYLDYVGENVYLTPRVSLKRVASPGLRFIKQNVPQVEILEYPLWHEYVKKLAEGWDVVGFSFFQNEIGEVVKMARAARSHGIRELWAGGYGALDPLIPSIVDRVFTGASEDQIAQVFGNRVAEDAVEHPVIIWPLSFEPGSIPYLAMGLLYTERGCPYKCTFCQTPVFDKRRFNINIESIERVVKYYHKLGITDILVLDEIFGISPIFADQLTRILARYRMRWWAQSRAALFLHHLDTWHQRGLRFPLIGVETMDQKAMDSVDKVQKLDQILEFERRSRELKAMYRMVYYMIGYEHQTPQSILQDVSRLKKVGFDAHQVNIITPFPGTPLWSDIQEKFGIFDETYRHYDAKYLVWNHPHISPSQMHYLLNSTIATLNQPLDIYGRGFTRLIRQRLKLNGLDFLWRDILRAPFVATFTNQRKQVFFPRLT